MRALKMALFTALAAVMLTGCKAFHTLGTNQKTAQGRPYELIVVINQPLWMGEVGDSLRALLAAPIPYLPQVEPEFDVQRVTPDGFKSVVVDHRNILKVLVEPTLKEAAVAVQYDLTATPQIVLLLQGPTEESLVEYLNAHGQKLLDVLLAAERDRAVAFAKTFGVSGIEQAAKERFGVTMAVPKGYTLAANEADFLWARYEYPEASQGFMLYSYPYTGGKDFTVEALVKARNRFAKRIPGPSDGSYMITAEMFEPTITTFRLNGRLWVEMRGFWDVENDFMGGPFVSYSTLDTATGCIFTYDCYVYAPKLPPHKRNLMRGLEHLLYTIELPKTASTTEAN